MDTFALILTILVALGLWWRRHTLLAIFWVVGVVGGQLIDVLLKLYFQRKRPHFEDPLVIERTTSFPSGHSMGSLVAYGLLAYLVVRFLPARRWRTFIVAVLACWVLAIGFSRVYLGHTS